ncbi:MAG: hypothetical protein JRM73_04360 [Nitrososphaerota archaeon]|nr:hypothetical protein [Nitrososphaerota archaeon]
MPKILYGVSPIGLGHATRSLVVIDELKRRGAGVTVFSGGNAAAFLKSQGLDVAETVDDAGPSVDGLVMGSVSSWYVRSWLAQKRNVKRAMAMMERLSPDVVVGDEEFSGVTAAGEAGVKRAFIADELGLGFARGWLARKVEGRVAGWYASLQASVDLLIVPERGEDGGNRRYVGPIVRGVTKSARQTKEEHGIPDGRFVLVSMSGSGIGRELAKRTRAALDQTGLDVRLVVTGNRGEKLGDGTIDLGVVGDNQNLVACADLVVSTAGKSTIDEAAAAGTPAIVIPIRYHAEQERNAEALGYAYGDLARLPELISEKMGKRKDPVPCDGHLRAADAILALARP